MADADIILYIETTLAFETVMVISADVTPDWASHTGSVFEEVANFTYADIIK